MSVPSRFLLRLVAAALACAVPLIAYAGPVAARRKQEPLHRAFLLKAASGKVLANAEESASVQGDLVHSRLTFRFPDGSIDDEEALFTQNGVFRLLSDHHVQKGPSFPMPADVAIDVPAQRVTWHETHFGKDRVRSQTVHLPDDLANGIMPLIVENFPPGEPAMRVSWVALAIRPLIVAISVHPNGASEQDPDGTPVRVNEFVLHPELHGLVSLVAPLLAKEPADIHIWVSDEKVPSFVRLAGPFYQGGPVWTVEPAKR